MVRYGLPKVKKSKSKGGNIFCKGLNPNTKSKDQGNLHDYQHIVEDFEAHSKRISSLGD